VPDARQRGIVGSQGFRHQLEGLAVRFSRCVVPEGVFVEDPDGVQDRGPHRDVVDVFGGRCLRQGLVERALTLGESALEPVEVPHLHEREDPRGVGCGGFQEIDLAAARLHRFLELTELLMDGRQEAKRRSELEVVLTGVLQVSGCAFGVVLRIAWPSK
jgi:hypothetical protein